MNTRYRSFAGSWMSTDPDTTNGNSGKERRTSMKGIVTILQLYCLKSMNDTVRMVITEPMNWLATIIPSLRDFYTVRQHPYTCRKHLTRCGAALPARQGLTRGEAAFTRRASALTRAYGTLHGGNAALHGSGTSPHKKKRRAGDITSATLLTLMLRSWS